MKCRKHRMSRIDAAALLALAALLGVGPATALEIDRTREILFEADSVERDEPNQRTIMTGNVRVQQGTLDIRAQRAVFFGPLESLQRLELEGSPATLSQSLEQRGGDLDASARHIEYNLVERFLILSGDAEVNQGNRHLSGETVRYDLARDRVIAEGDAGEDGQQVRIRIRPESPETDGN